MKELEIQKIIVKFINKEANINELEELNAWLKNSKNTSVFNEFVKVELLTALSLGDYNINKAKEAIQQKVRKVKYRKKIKFFKKIAIAASILLIVSISFFQFENLTNSSEKKLEVVAVIEVGSSKAILTLENGSKVSLKEGKDYKNNEVSSNGEELRYTQNKENKLIAKKIEYNYLTIPRGGEYSLVLSDGTKIKLNSDSKLKYPTKFAKGKTREVELIYGEAFFDVSSSKKHQGASFNVLTKNQKIDVLGTLFNVKAYSGDDVISTTLVEGKVTIQKGDVVKELYPNQQAKIKYNSNTISIQDVDVSLEISWINGVFSFNEEPLDELMKVLARWYDVEVNFEVEQQKKLIFTGVLEKSKSINDILDVIKKTSEGEIEFKITDKKIQIK